MLVVSSGFSQTKPIREDTVLDNGLRVIIDEDKNSALTAIYIKILAGLSAEDKFAGSGISHFIEHMVFKGEPSSTEGELAKKIRDNGGFINATTGLDSTTYFVIAPKENALTCLETLGKAVLAPGFDPAHVEKERNVILNEIKFREDDPSEKISTALFANAYIKHPYRFPIIGYEELLRRLSREDLLGYHKKYYVPNNMVITVTGNVDAERTMATIKQIFDGIKRGDAPVYIVPVEPKQITTRKMVKYTGINLGYLAMGYHTTGVLDEDIYALDVLSNILGNGSGSRLNKTLVKEKRLLFSIDTMNYTPLYPGLFLLSGIGEPANLDAAVKNIKEQAELIKNGIIEDDEIARSRNQTIAGFLKSLESVNARANITAESTLYTGDPDFLADYVEKMKKVSKNDVVAAARKYLTETNMTVVFLLPETDIPVKQTAGHEEKIPESQNAQKIVLDNGIRVILKRNPRVEMASLAFAWLGGLRAEPGDKPGISSFTTNMLLKGTKTRKESEIAPYLENKGGKISAFSGMNSSGITLEILSGSMYDSLDILEDVIKNPIFPEDEIEKLRTKTVASITMDEDDPFRKASAVLKKDIFKTHPYGNRIAGTVDSVKRLTKKDMEDFYRGVMDPKNIVITCVGSFDTDKVVAALKTKFTDIKGNGLSVDHKEVPLQSKEEKIIEMPKEEVVHFIGFNGVTVLDPDRYAIDVLFSVMTGLSGRLFDSIRDKLGLSYTQGGDSVVGIDPGYCFFYVATDEKGRDTSRNIVIKEIERIRKEKVSDEELKGAKNVLLGHYLMSLETNSSLSHVMAMDELCSLGYDNYLKYPEMINQITKEDVQKAAIKYLNLDRSSSVTVLPGRTGDRSRK